MKNLRIHCIQHVPFEGPAIIEQWANQKGHRFSFTRLYESSNFPDIENIDWLIVMGGPMGIYNDDIYPWLAGEKEFIKSAIDHNKTVIGICLGAQLIADVLGAEVKPGKYKEIGWFPIIFKREAWQKAGYTFLPDELTVFHWHGDTFDIPEGAIRLATSEGCVNQAFIYGDRVLAFQFHFEMDLKAIELIVRHGQEELIPDVFVQNYKEILTRSSLAPYGHTVIQNILNHLVSISIC